MSRRPSVLFVNQHYWPDVAATGQMLSDLAEHLVADGFDVHVLAGATHYAGGAVAAPRHETRRGVVIHRVRTTAFGRGRTLGRLADYASFFGGALARLVAGRRYDLVVLLTTPPLLPTLGAFARAVRGVRYAVWSMDLHPDAEVALGMLRERSLPARVLHALNNWGYRRASAVVALGTYMAQRIAAKGVAGGRLHTIPVWNGRDDVVPQPVAGNAMRRQLGIADDAFVVMYSGNAGLAHGFEEVLDAMRRLRHRPDVQFVFAGGGPRRRELEAAAAADPGLHVRFLDYVPREALDDALALGNAHLLTLRADMAGIAVPSKLFGIFAAARPALVVAPEASEPAEAVAAVGAGVVVAPGPDGGAALAHAIEHLAAHPDEASAMGARGRALFLDRFERDGCCDAWARLLREVVSPEATPSATGVALAPPVA